MSPLVARLIDLQRSSERLVTERTQHPLGLTNRETEVLRLVAAGRTNPEIADELVVSVNTVLHHVSNIFNKTGAKNRTEAAVIATKQGLHQSDG